MSKVRWGVLSTANIATKKVIPAMLQGSYTEVAAISSRSVESAREAAASLGIAKAYGSYEELLADPDIDVIYNPLPNHLHCEWSVKAMEAGKHVLCEKPLGMTVDDVENLIKTRDRCGVKAGEAFMVKSHPQWLAARDQVTAGDIGRLRMIQGTFSYYNADPANIRNIPEIGGGAMWDIGCYPVTLSRFIFREEPLRVAASFELDPEMGTDRLSCVIMEFPSGKAMFGVSTQLVPFQRMHLFGTNGHLEVVVPFNAPKDRPCQLRYDAGSVLQDEVHIQSFETMDQYTAQADDFSRAVLLDGEVPSTLEDALANTRVLMAIFRAAAEKRWVDVRLIGAR